jgi:hypothetical protein
MKKSEALEKFKALFLASSVEDPLECTDEVFKQLIKKATDENSNPEEAVEAAAIVLTISLGDEEEEQ